MKVLWFTNTPSLYDKGKHSYHGGGWIESLEKLIRDNEEIELAIGFFHITDSEKEIKNNTTYYPILSEATKRTPFEKLLNNWRAKLEDSNLDRELLAIIRDFRPDVIQVFGTEGPFAKIQEITNIPVVIHVQGIINPCLNSYYPPNYSKWNFLLNKNYFINNLLANSPAFGKNRFSQQANREKNFLSQAKYIMGRTHWDKMLAKLYNPQVEYFHVNEVLRPVFYNLDDISKYQTNKKFKIVSTLSPTVYKGIDVVLKTAKKLIELVKFEFQWEIIGLDKNTKLLQQFEDTENIRHQEVNIICRGRKNPEEMVELLQEADVFVHPSYIDNSPNSLCEAQVVGLPVIACDVGGIASLVNHSETGFLIPSNGVFELVHYLRELNENKNLRDKIGQQAKHIASQRHNHEKILIDLFGVYSEIINKNEKP